MKKVLYLLVILASLLFVSAGCTPKSESPVSNESSTANPVIEVSDTLTIEDSTSTN